MLLTGGNNRPFKVISCPNSVTKMDNNLDPRQQLSLKAETLATLLQAQNRGNLRWMINWRRAITQ
jgi:hypothetical protein